MFTIVLYVTLCMSGIDECHAQEPLSWRADADTLAATVGICRSLAEDLEVTDGPHTLEAECHVLPPDEQDTQPHF